MRRYISNRTARLLAVFFLLNMVWEITFPAAVYALTGGPSQPEVQSFEPVGTSEMVDLFSGDFVYNIPLLDVEGYPINISYHSGIGMDDEASWVGLGWNINPGVVNRSLRGIPDDFNGDQIKSVTNIQKDETYGITLSPSTEFVGVEPDPKDAEAVAKKAAKLAKLQEKEYKLSPSLGLSFGIFYNNYKGLGYEISVSPRLSWAKREKPKNTYSLGFDFSANSQSGADIEFDGSFGKVFSKSIFEEAGLSFKTSVNSRRGLKEMTFGTYSKGGYKLFKGDKSSRSFQAGKSYSLTLNPTTYTPSIENEFVNYSANVAFKFGFEFLMLNWRGDISGYYSGQYLRNNNKSRNAYGYLYAHNGEDAYKESSGHPVMFDLNREMDGPYMKGKPFLPMPNFTYDMFSISGEGTGGVIRPFRGDVGMLYDNRVNNNTIGMGFGYEFGTGNILKWGLDLSGNYGYTQSGKWTGNKNDFDIVRFLSFQKPLSAQAYEPAYFRNVGERIAANNELYNTLGNSEPVTIQISNSAAGRLNSVLIGKSNTPYQVKNTLRHTQRQKRNTAIASLTNYEADKMALDRRIKIYPKDSFIMAGRSMKPKDTIIRYDESSVAYKDRMSEMIVLNPDGRRYVYGIPAHNNLQTEASFRVTQVGNPDALTKNPSVGLVNYASGDNSTGNSKGEDNFFNRTELPKYAHSFLLTSILSPDYIDITGDGISDDDVGTAIKINYSRVFENYKWRTPFGRQERQGNYDEGLKSDKYDDRANYVYGEKEIWYVHSIESKNYVACFYISKRDDANQVLGENGGIDTSAAFNRLDSIQLYTKQELLENGASAIPLKTVHFEYDYSLCPNAENNKYYDNTNEDYQSHSGKLTLKKIYFTYGKSQKGRTNAYQFTYSDYNPKYNLRGYDRWGNYKPNATPDECNSLTDSGKRLSNVDDPYVLQNKDSADLYSSAWSLSQIKLPSGGTINVNYESDDYAYIQDRRAGQMFKVVGISNDESFQNTRSLLYDGETNYTYLFFDLVQPFSKSISEAEKNKHWDDYFKGIDNFYFKFLVDVTNAGDFEYISGYAEQQNLGFASRNPAATNYDLGFVRVKTVALNDKKGEMNPISKASWNFMRQSMPRKLQKLFSKYEQPPGSTKFAFESLVSSVGEMFTMYKTLGRRLRDKSAGQKFIYNKSFVRLNNPTKMKYGGGCRVKRVTLNDNWDEMVNGYESATYGQDYFYTTEETQQDGSSRTISSGVAAYEPMMGGDENSWKQPIRYTGSNTLAMDDQYLMETPIGESFFPAPGVGYSKVTTVNIKPTANIKRTGTGMVVNEFYTAYDFPVFSDYTNILTAPKHNKPGFLASFLKVYSKEKMFTSQGYSIEINDMHGKPKAQWVYEEGNPNAISGVKYEYYYQKNGLGKNQLSGIVDVVNPDGSISSKEVAKEMDYAFDIRNNYSYHASAGARFNIDNGLASVLPFSIPTIFPSFAAQKLEFGSAVSTKVIYKYGVLKYTEVFENGASVKSENVLFDSETGDVLLTKTTNEFNDTIFTFNYPAHFVYDDGMGQAYKNIGYTFSNISFDNGKIQNLANYQNYFVPGDELYVEKVTLLTPIGSESPISLSSEILPTRIWAVQSPHHADQLVFLTRTGSPFETDATSDPGTYVQFNAKIIRSGRRNMQSTSIGTVVTLTNPVKNGTLSFDSVINASAVENSDYWPVEHKIVYEAIDLPAGDYSGAGSPPGGDDIPLADCNSDCYNQLVDKLFTLPSAGPGFYKTLLNTDLGDTINLMQSPYQSLFLCALGQLGPCTQFDWIHELKDSLMINTGQQTITSLFDRNSEIRYASNYPKEDNSITGLMSLRGPDNSGLTENISADLFNTSPQVASSPASGCDICGEILSRSSYKVKSFGMPNGCTLKVIIQCINLSDCEYPVAEPITCTLRKTSASGYSYIKPFHTTVKTFEYPDASTLGCNQKALVYTDQECPPYFYGPYKKVNPNPQSGGGGGGSGGGGLTEVCNDSVCDDSALLIPMNPYVYGIKGNWRPKRSWLFYDKRNQASTTNIRKDGTYKNYTDFWKKPTMGSQHWDTGTSIGNKWVWNTQVTKFNRTGNEVENVDALGIYSAALFGYGNSIVKAVGNNSRLRQLAFDGMEDHAYPNSMLEDHFSFNKYFGMGNVVDSVSHTGLNSLAIDTGTTASVLTCVIYAEKENEYPITDTTQNLIKLKPKEILDKFSPDSGKYIFSAWVKEQRDTPQYTSYSDTAIIKIYHNTCEDIYKLTPSGPIIEGWQRIEGAFTVPDSATCFEVILKPGGARTVFVDDIRMHPWQGNMKSFVYHPKTLRLIAELDENNYATFYEYDDEGRLVRIKRETERGIVTLQESRTGLKINH